MTKENIVEKVDEFLIDDFEVEEEALVPDANLKDALDLDSLDFVDLVVAVESNFGVKLTGEDFVNINTLQNFYDLIERKLAWPFLTKPKIWPPNGKENQEVPYWDTKSTFSFSEILESGRPTFCCV